MSEFLIKPKIKNTCRFCAQKIDFPFLFHKQCIEEIKI